MKENAFSERFSEARAVGVGRLLSVYVAVQSTDISFDHIDIAMNEQEVGRNAGFVDEINPAKIVVPGI